MAVQKMESSETKKSEVESSKTEKATMASSESKFTLSISPFILAIWLSTC